MYHIFVQHHSNAIRRSAAILIAAIPIGATPKGEQSWAGNHEMVLADRFEEPPWLRTRCRGALAW